ncbi:MAG: ABC transporter permease [Pseudomonadota bacterium]
MASDITIPRLTEQGALPRLRAGISINRLRQLARGVAPALWLAVFPVVVLSTWWWGTTAGWLPEQILPRPGEVLHALIEMTRSGELGAHAGISLLRVAYGFVAGAAIGLVLGAAMGLSRTVDDYVAPLFTAIAQVPALAWIPLAMLLLGIGEALKVVVIAKATLVPVVMNTRAGVRSVPRGLVEVGDSFRFSTWQALRLIVLPGAVPPIFTGLRYGLTHAWIALVSVELLASSEGLGYLLVWGRQMFWLDTVLMAMLVIGVIGFASDKVLAMVERRLQRWRTDGVV